MIIVWQTTIFGYMDSFYYGVGAVQNGMALSAAPTSHTTYGSLLILGVGF